MWQSDPKIHQLQRESRRLARVINGLIVWHNRRDDARAYVRRFEPTFREGALRSRYGLCPHPGRRWRALP